MSTHTQIADLNKMEEIVRSNDSLEWDGWDVIQYKDKPVSFMNPKGVLRNGKWVVAIRYPVTEHGWKFPRRLINVAG